MKFNPIDINTWERGQIFYYFSEMAPTGYSLTVDIDVTHMREVLKSAGLKFYPAYLWLVTKTLSAHKEFKLAKKDGCLGYYDTLTPLYAVFHPDDNTFSLMWTKFDDDFKAFYKACTDDMEKHRNQHGILAQSDTLPPENAYTVSCLPWVSFRHFCVHSYENKPYYFPSVESGKFYEADGRIMMPLSITCHHAASDGWHVSRFIESFCRSADEFEEFIR